MTTHMKQFASLVATFGLAASFAAPAAVLAQVYNSGQGASGGALTTDDLGMQNIQNDIKLGSGDVRSTAARIINVALGFLGIIAVVIVLIGGFKYMVSGGNDDKTADARRLIVSGIIGLAIILSAWAITGFVVGNLVNATTS
jgi:hypothetical protein